MNKSSMKKFCIALLGIANILAVANVKPATQKVEETTIAAKYTQKMQEERKRMNELYLPKGLEFEFEEDEEKSKRKKENDLEM